MFIIISYLLIQHVFYYSKMFKFNFSLDESKQIEEQEVELNNHDIKSECGLFDLNSVEENICFKRVDLTRDVSIECVSTINKLGDNLNEINKTHDVVPGKYEGGLKIWESSVDLARYLVHNPLKFDRKINILELGCGHALPVLALIKTMSCDPINSIYLQDFNKECLEKITCPNIAHALLSTNQEACIVKKIKFVYGDWKHILLNKLLPQNYFDLILTSETIYNNLNYTNLLNLMKYSLNFKDNGHVLLAAKTYYFGCKGNIHDFCLRAKSKDYLFKCSDNLLTSINVVSPKDTNHAEMPNISREIIKMY